MRKTFALTIITIMLAGLLMVPLSGNVSENFVPISDNEPFVISTDGDVSTESIISFSETLADDELFYPDVFCEGVDNVADAGTYAPGQLETYVKTWVDDPYGNWVGLDTTSPYSAHLILHFYLPTFNGAIESIEIRTITAATDTGNVAYTPYNISVYNYGTSTYDLQYTNIHDTSMTVRDTTLHDTDYFSDTVLVKIHSTNFTGDGGPKLFWDYSHVIYSYMTLADSDHYAESFADVSDWSAWNSVEDFGTDGDVGYFEAHGESANDYEGIQSIGHSIPITDDTYFELSIKANVTFDDYPQIRFYDGAGYKYIQASESTSFVTWKYHINSLAGSAISTVDTIIISARIDLNVDVKISFDHLRIGPSTEMGWQHDASTLEGLSEMRVGDTPSTDGDVVHITNTHATAGAGFQCEGLRVSTTYYPFLEVRWKSAATSTIVAEIADENSAHTYEALGMSTSWHISRINVKTEIAGDYITKVNIYDETNNVQEIWVDYVELYSIANWTISPNPNVVNVAYVESGELVITTVTDAGTFAFDFWPEQSMSIATYNVWNFTSSTGVDLSGSLDFSFKPTVDGSEGNYGDETRGTWTGLSGTLTSTCFWVRTAVTIRISAIKFWEDSTAPTIADKWVNPPEPYDDEDTTITIAATDGVDIYTVKLNAETYPAGFSDVDYTMTETIDNALYKYTFSGMIAGYYGFIITVDDGAQTYIEYIPVTVRESEIDVDPISFFGVGEDFTVMTFSFEINKACSYVINEASENVGASDTHSGSVSEGMQNVAWTKLTTDDALVNFTITFTNASLTYVIDGQYQVAQTALSVSSYDWGFSETNIAISFQTSKGGTYTVYLDDVQDSTSSFVTGSNFLTWIRSSSTDPAEIDAGVKLTDGTTTIWLNQTYDEFALTIFSIQTLFMDLTDPTISAIFTTSWGNATGYLYEDDVQQDTAAEGITLSYSKTTVAGTYNVALKIDAGGEIAWYNTTYSVSAEDSLSIMALSFDSGGPNITVFVNTNWANCTLTIYENDVQKATGSEGMLSYLKAIIAGDYNVSVKVDGTANVLWANYTYTVGTEASLIINALVLDKSGPDITAFVTTNWLNSTIYLYQNDVEQATGPEGSALSYAKSTAAGTYNVALKIDAGGEIAWYNDTYTIAAATLDITPISFFGVGEDFTQMSVSFECSLSGSWSIVEWVQADGSDAAETHTGSVTVGWNNIAWTKLDTTSDIVYFNMTVTSGVLSETIPGLYGVAQLVLVITARPLSLANDEIIFSGQANKIGTWTLYLDDVQESTDTFLDSSFVINWTRAQSIALEKVAFALKFVNSTDTIWINGTYDKYSLVALTLATFDLDWFQNNITSLHLTTSWGNTTIDVWLNGSLVINNHAEGLFNFTRSSNEGYFNVTIVIDGGADTITYKAWVYFTTEGVTYEGDTTYNSAYSSTQNVYEGPVTIVDPDTVVIEGDVSFDDDKEEELAEAQWNTLRLIIEVISFPTIMAIAYFMGKARRQRKPRDRTSDVFRDQG